MEREERRGTPREASPGAPNDLLFRFTASVILGGVLTFLIGLVEVLAFFSPTLIPGVVHFIIQVALAIGVGVAGFSTYYHHGLLLRTAESRLREELDSVRRQLEVSTSTDEVTGLQNYRYFRERLQQEMLRAQRYGTSLSILVMDLDNFKEVNQRYGRQVGDGVLRRFAVLILRRTLRGSDVLTRLGATDTVARYGGDEFIVILPETNRQGAVRASERLREAAQKGTLLPNGQRLSLSLSIGIGTYPTDATSRDSLIWAADQALNMAKSSRLGIAWPGLVGPVAGGTPPPSP